MNLTKPQKRALQILHKHGPLHPREFARLMWPDSLGWKRMHKCGNYGASPGAMMAMVGGGYLAKLRYRGWVGQSWRTRWIGNRPRSLGHSLTDEGYKVLRGEQ